MLDTTTSAIVFVADGADETGCDGRRIQRRAIRMRQSLPRQRQGKQQKQSEQAAYGRGSSRTV